MAWLSRASQFDTRAGGAIGDRAYDRPRFEWTTSCDVVLVIPSVLRRLMTLLLASQAVACGSAMTFSNNGSFDQQRCVEEALRRRPKLSEVGDAVSLFRTNCNLGDSAACSALGVMYEVGVGKPADAKHAGKLFTKACVGKNQLGCENLAKLLELRAISATSQRIALLRESCRGTRGGYCYGMWGAIQIAGAVPDGFGGGVRGSQTASQ